MTFIVANGSLFQPEDCGAVWVIRFVCKQTRGYCQKKAPWEENLQGWGW